MGSIYEVRHRRLSRSFAVKKLDAALADSNALQRFRREVEVVARLRHPNIVAVTDWETFNDGAPCMVMEFLEGEDLDQHIRRVGAMAWPALAAVADQVMSALSAAHRAGIVHRDLKPHNIF